MNFTKNMGVSLYICTVCLHFGVTLMSQLYKNNTNLVPLGVIFFYSVSFLTKFLIKNRVKLTIYKSRLL